MTLATDINDACHTLPLLGRYHRYCLIERILGHLEACRATALEGVPLDKHIWVETLIATVRSSINEISAMETLELRDILREFEKLIALLDGIAASAAEHTTLH